MVKSKEKSVGSPKRAVDSPKSPKRTQNESHSTFVRERLRRPDPLPPISVTPYPLSTSSEMAMAMSSDAHTLQDRMKSLSDQIKTIQKLRDSHEPTLNAIDNLSEKVITEGKVTPSYRSKLKNLYEKGSNEAKTEADLIRKALDSVHNIRNIRHELRLQAKNSGNKETIRRGALMKMLQNSAQTLPLWFGKPNDKPPYLCGAIASEPNYIAKAGDMVAALVKGHENEDNWILAEVISYNASTNKYEVDDIDEEQKERHILSKRRIYPLPLMRANPETNPQALYVKGSFVNALYPQTTCFYKAIINRVPSLATEEYEVLFEDSSYADGYSPPLMVAQRYIIQLKESIKKK